MVQSLSKLNPFKGQYQKAVCAFDALTGNEFVKVYSGTNRSRYPDIEPIANWHRFSRDDVNVRADVYKYKNRGIVAIMEESAFGCCGKIPFITGDDITVYEMIFIPKSNGDSLENEEELFKRIIIESGGFSETSELSACKTGSQFLSKDDPENKNAEKDWHMAAKMIGFSYPRRQVRKREIDRDELIKTLKILDEFYKSAPIY
ncbi:Uncharacterised protein [uncultured archaeon]|nr:Uncharacterised protein [uncultured archaeon]